MSFLALQWAGSQRFKRAADKLTLLALADRHNEKSGLAYPSVAWISDYSGLDRKTVMASMARLEALGLIADSGERRGQTGQVKAYKLALNSTENGTGNDAENGTVESSPKTGRLTRKKASKSTVFSVKESQKRDTEPVTEPKKEELQSDPVLARELESSIAAELVALVGMPENGNHSGEVARQQVRGWMALGADADMLRSVIGEHVGRYGGETAALKRFDTPVKSALKARGGGLEGVDRVAAFDPKNQRAVVDMYRAGQLVWDEDRWALYGAPPGQPGCRLDPRIVEQVAA